MMLFQRHVPAGLPPYLLCHALDNIFFLFLFENIEDSQLQVSQRDNSNEYPYQIHFSRNKEKAFKTPETH